MPEVRRFMRYTLPGIACSVLVFLSFLISDLPFIVKMISNLEVSIDSLAIVIGGFLASGGIGYLFSIIYFGLVWTEPFSIFLAIDHRTIFKKSYKDLSILDLDDNEIELKNISQRDAWTLFTQYWNSKHSQNVEFVDSEQYFQRIFDIFHGLGATIIGTLISMSIWFVSHYFVLENPSTTFYPQISVYLMWVAVVTALLRNYFQTKKSIQVMLNSIFTEVIKKKLDKDEKIVIYFIKN